MDKNLWGVPKDPPGLNRVKIKIWIVVKFTEKSRDETKKGTIIL